MEPLELPGEEEIRAIYQSGEEATVRLFNNLIQAILSPQTSSLFYRRGSEPL